MILRSSGISGILLPELSWKCYLFTLSQKLQVDVGKVNEEKTLLSSIVKNTQGREIKICNFKIIFQNFRGKQGFKQSHGEDFQ